MSLSYPGPSGSGGSLSYGVNRARPRTLRLNWLAQAFSETVTYSGTGGTTIDSAGNMVAASAPRRVFDHATLLPLGFLREEGRANAIRNNSMVGASAGSPGTAPTNWAITSVSGVAPSIVGTGTDRGVAYVDVRWVGTASAGGALSAYFESATGIVAATAQTWTVSSHLKLQAGSTAGVNSFNYVFDENTAAGAFVANTVAVLAAPTSATLIGQRPAATRTLAGGGTVARLRPYLYMPVTNGAVVDITLRIGYPQAEIGAFASSVIITAGSAVTRTEDSGILTGSAFSNWYNPAEGTLVVRGRLLNGTASTFPYVCAATSATPNSDAIGIPWTAVTGTLRGTVSAGGVTEADVSTGASKIPGDSFVAALGYSSGRTVFASGGVLGTPDTGSTLPMADRFTLGGSVRFQPGSNMILASVDYYAKLLPDATVTALSLS